MKGLAHRYLFVGGLHRSGTSLVARLAASIDAAGGIEGAPVPENEGVYLQGAIPHTALHGRPGHFATDPAQHLVEGHGLDRLETRLRLEADWDPWFAPDLRWRVEKSPVNLTRMRLYQQVFPLAQFVVVVRHPVAVAAAMGKWVDTPVPDLLTYWHVAHAGVLEDLEHLHAALILRYEDLVADPARVLAALAAFLGERPPRQAPALHDGNADYPQIAMTRLPPDIATRFGYGDFGAVVPASLPLVRHPLRSRREAVLACLDGGLP